MNEAQLKAEYRHWRESLYRPIRGAEGDDDNKDGDDNTDDDNETTEDKAGDDTSTDDADNSTDDSDDKNGDDGSAALQKQVKDLTDKLAKAEHAAATAKKEASQAKSEVAEKSGNFKQLAAQREAELNDEREAKLKVEDERDKAVGELTDFQKQVRVTRIATRLGYRDPEDAMAVLRAQEWKMREAGEEMELMADDATCERALKKLGDEKKYLVDQKRRTGAPINGSGSTGLSMERVKAMTEAEYIANKGDVDKFLASQGSG